VDDIDKEVHLSNRWYDYDVLICPQFSIRPQLVHNAKTPSRRVAILAPREQECARKTQKRSWESGLSIHCKPQPSSLRYLSAMQIHTLLLAGLAGARIGRQPSLSCLLHAFHVPCQVWGWKIIFMTSISLLSQAFEITNLGQLGPKGKASVTIPADAEQLGFSCAY